MTITIMITTMFMIAVFLVSVTGRWPNEDTFPNETSSMRFLIGFGLCLLWFVSIPYCLADIYNKYRKGANEVVTKKLEPSFLIGVIKDAKVGSYIMKAIALKEGADTKHSDDMIHFDLIFCPSTLSVLKSRMGETGDSVDLKGYLRDYGLLSEGD